MFRAVVDSIFVRGSITTSTDSVKDIWSIISTRMLRIVLGNHGTSYVGRRLEGARLTVKSLRRELGRPKHMA